MAEDVTTRGSRSDARRLKLLATARKLFAHQGFHLTGMSQIARESGIAVGQIYRDFASKEAIIVALADESLHEWLEEEMLDAAIEARDAKAIDAWIMRMLMDDCDFEERRMMVEVIAESGRSPIIAELNFKILASFRKLLDRALLSLAPATSPVIRIQIINLIQILSWGIAVGQELDPDMDHAAMREYAAYLVRREIGID